MFAPIRLNILYIGAAVLIVKTEAGLLDSVPLIGNLNNARNQAGRYQTNQWMGNNNNALQGVASALVGLTGNSDQNSRANLNLNGQNIGLNSRYNNAGNLGRLNWNSMNRRPEFNNINKPNIGQRPALDKEKEDLEKLIERLKNLQKFNGTTPISNYYNDSNLTNQRPSTLNNINKPNIGQRATLEKQKEDLEKLLEQLKELNRLKDLQKNNETSTPSSNNNTNAETAIVPAAQGGENTNHNSWTNIENRKIMHQMKPIFPEGDTPPTSYNAKTVYYLLD